MLAPQIERLDDLGVTRLADAASLGSAVAMITTAIDEARRQGIGRLLITFTEVNGLAPPSLAARHAMVREWARAAGGRVRLALVLPPHFIDADKFGVVAAANFGLIGNGFTTEAEAMAWLREIS